MQSGRRAAAVAIATALLGVRAAHALTHEQRQERYFLREAAAHLRFENEAAKLALAKSSNATVRQLAAALANHCNEVLPEVLYLLHVRGMAMPMLGAGEWRALKTLQNLAGARFDRAFLEEAALRANQRDAAEYEHIAAVTRDPQLRAWAERQVPTLRYHAGLASRALGGGAEASKMARLL